MARSSSKLSFKANLSGQNQVPPVVTEAEGRARLRFNEAITILQVRLTVEDIKGVVLAHIHMGRPGQNGAVIAGILSASDPTDFPRDTLICRTVTRGDLTGPLKDKPLSALLEVIRAGNAYVNVHTVQRPEGEIRGPIEPVC